VKRFYLPQLDGIRWLAFLLVFVHHAPPAAHLFQPGSVGARVCGRIQEFGWIGVDLFLVLSAYLITTLLLLEHAETGRIALRDFYVRRILRIWPIYYLMLAVGFVLLPALGYFAPTFDEPRYGVMVSRYLVPLLTFFGNFAIGKYLWAPVWTLDHLWTIALEEQFYIVWPPLLMLLLRGPRRLVWGVLPLLLASTIATRAYLVEHSSFPMLWTNTASRLDPLLAGIALALYRRSRPVQRKGAWGALEFLAGCAVAGSIAFGPKVNVHSYHQVWQFAATALGFTLTIDAALGSGPVAWAFSRRWIAWLGRLTYGLYVYHILSLQIGGQLAGKLSAWLGLKHPAVLWLVSATLSLAMAIAIATLSYYTIERFFLRLKGRFTHVQSQPLPAERNYHPQGEAGQQQHQQC
jgi:peptidoglycan/LPS O-acetylase OafA/YrhL